MKHYGLQLKMVFTECEAGQDVKDAVATIEEALQEWYDLDGEPIMPLDFKPLSAHITDMLVAEGFIPQ